MPKCNLTFSRGCTNLFSVESFLKVAILFIVALLLSAQPASAGDALKFFENYFVTGDYVAGGTSLLGRGVKSTATQNTTRGVSTYATGVIHMSGVPGYVANGVPQHADIVAAYLYWETLATINADATQLAKGTFRGLNLLGTQIAATGTRACGLFGALANVGGGQTLYVFRADVLKYLPYKRDPTTGQPLGQRLVNDADLAANHLAPHTVSLPDSGIGWLLSFFTHQPAFLTEGASLVVVYRVAGAPLKSVVIYNGGFAMSSQNPQMMQTMLGFYQASSSSPAAKMTQIVGDGFCLFKEHLTVNNEVPTGVSPTNPFQSALFGNSWTTLTFDVSKQMLGGADSIMTSVVPLDPGEADCLSWSVIVLSTTVQASDGDGLVDIWKTTSGLTDPNNNPLPDLPAMGAKKGQKDIFVEIDYMKASGYGNSTQVVSAHSHLPTLEALQKVAAAFSNFNAQNPAIEPIKIHFDVGNNYQTTPPQDFIVPANVARGGDAIDEVSSPWSCSGPQSPTCPYPDYPGTVSWKDGFQLIKNGGTFGGTLLPPHFDQSRKDTVHYAVSVHALGLPRWWIDDKSLTNIVVTNHTATATTQVPHGLNGMITATVLGAPVASNLNGKYTAAASGSTLTFTTGAANGTYQNWGLAVSDGTPRSNSGGGDVGGGDLMISLGRWDNFTGTTFMQASTLLHELGHNLGFGHGGDPSDPVNCKPNYQSSMNYLNQVQGLLDQNGVPRIDYSNQALPTLNERSLNESPSGLGTTTLAYLPRWYAPSSFPITSGFASSATKHCDGTPITNGAVMFRIDGKFLSTSSLDWDNEGSSSLSNPVPPQDINFDGTIAAAPGYQGFNDWLNINLQQVGARRGAAGVSDNLSPGQDMDDNLGIAGGDLGIAGGDLGIAGGDLGIAGGDLGIAGGDLGIAGGDLGIAGSAGGELNFETAKAVPSAPSALMAAAVTDGVDLKWSPPNVGTVNHYTVWRATCASGTTVATCASTVPAPLATGVSPTAVCDTSFIFCDNLTSAPAGDDAFYLYFVTATFDDRKTSGPSNQAVQTELDLAAAVPTGLTATSLTDSVGLKWNPPSFGTVITYTLWRRTCPDQTCATPESETLTSFSVSPGTFCGDTSYNYCDKLLISSNNDDAYYIYYVTATFGDDASGPSNAVVGSEIMGGNNDSQ